MKQKFIVIPFRSVRGKPQLGEMRQAQSEAGAVRMAELMSGRFVGVAAFEVHVDEETGDMVAPRELAVFGVVPDIMANMLAA